MYETLEELVIAYRNGDLTAQTPLLLDTDETSVFTDDTEEFEGEKVFDGGVPMELLIEALDLLGIPSEGV